MTIIYVTEDYICHRIYVQNTNCYGVTFENNGWIKVQNFEDISDDKNTIYCVKSLEIFLGKSESRMMTALSGAFNKSVLDGITFLLKISEEKKHRYLYIGGDMVCSFLTNDEIYNYISNMGNKLTPYSIAIGEEINFFQLHISNLIKEKT